ncbi:MAG: glutaredoxin 3 [Deltaproteobacteria bacterium]|nr:glutaredoxin 3 [Deltaproteobacteria bacterium]
MAEVVIYTTDYCGYCYRAKSLLEKLRLPYREIDVTGDQEARKMLVQRTGQRTVPQIFIDDESIGGYDELSVLARSGKLR